MRKAVSALLLLLAWTSVHAAPVLVGKWKSDHDLTMRFARERSKMEDKTILFLDQMMGRMNLVFTPSIVSSEMPDWQSESLDGAKANLVGFRESHQYKVLGATADQVAVDSLEPVTGRRKITVYTFDNEDTMWVYVGSASSQKMNIREYFVRIK